MNWNRVDGPRVHGRRRRGAATTAMVLTISVLLTVTVGLVELHRVLSELSPLPDSTTDAPRAPVRWAPTPVVSEGPHS